MNATASKKPETGTAVALPTPNTGLIAHFAGRYGIDADKMLITLKDTAFKQKAKSGAEPKAITNEQMMALLVIAKEYGLNPFTREIYAFPADNGIVPIIGFDGWVRLINSRPELDYMDVREAPPETEKDEYYVEVEIKRKDRSRPTIIREYFKECYRDTGPWNDFPRRMTRHKAIIQAGRIAFGYAGVFDPDDAERSFANAIDVTPRDVPQGKPKTAAPQARKPEPAAENISVDQITAILDKAKEEGVDFQLVLAAFELDEIGELPANQFGAAMAQIDSLSAGG